jgi:hypothetical protein
MEINLRLNPILIAMVLEFVACVDSNSARLRHLAFVLQGKQQVSVATSRRVEILRNH